MDNIHCFPLQVLLFQHGCKIGLYGGDPKKLIDDMKILQPTLFVTVPRLLNRIYDKVLVLNAFTEATKTHFLPKNCGSILKNTS